MHFHPTQAFLVLSIVTIVSAYAIPSLPSKLNEIEDISDQEVFTRIRRQDEEFTTTPKPKSPPKKRPSNIFSLLSVLIGETRNDARRAFGEIRKMVNSQFAPTTKKSPITNGKSSTTTAATTGEDGETSSTTEAYRISREEFNGILGNNFRGIVRLFGAELRNALRDSGKNVVDFGREFRSQIRPYVEIRV